MNKQRFNEESARQALERIENGDNTANHETIIREFANRGIPIEEIKPRENVFTYQAWQAKGRQVMKRPPHVPSGQFGVKIPVVFEKTDPETKKVIKRFTRQVTVFHISQTYEIGTEPPQAQNEPNSVQTGSSGYHHTPQPAKIANPSHFKPSQRAERISTLREKADSLQKQIDYKLNPPIANQNLTRRRISIAQSMREEGMRLLDVQRGLRAIADSLESDTLPDCLSFVRSSKDVREILYGWSKRDSLERQLLSAMINHQPAYIDPVQIQIREAEEALVGQKIPGFFPTPHELADAMVKLARLEDDNEVLEPSAGKGDLADAVMRYCKDNNIEVTLSCIETQYELCQILELKGYQYFKADFMTVSGTVDRIIMNPPYEHGTDAMHFLHAFEMLNPGGVVVALLGLGVTFRKGKHETKFQAKLEHWEKTGEEAEILHYQKIDNAFKGRQSFNQTGVSCLLIAVRKGA